MVTMATVLRSSTTGKLLKKATKKFYDTWIEMYGEPEFEVAVRDDFIRGVMNKLGYKEETFIEALSNLTGVEIDCE